MTKLVNHPNEFVLVLYFLCPLEIGITHTHKPDTILVTDAYIILPGHTLQGCERAGRHAERHQLLRLRRVLRNADVRNAGLLGEKTQDIAQGSTVEGEGLGRHATKLHGPAITRSAVVGPLDGSADRHHWFARLRQRGRGKSHIGRSQDRSWFRWHLRRHLNAGRRGKRRRCGGRRNRLIGGR